MSFFFFLMIRRPPRSTLFPTRRSSDLVILRTEGLEQSSSLIMEHVKKVKPAIVVVDSFKALDDLAESHQELRKFGYELAVNLMAWETTALLLGEYSFRRSEEHTSELQSQSNLVCRLLL